MLRVVHAVCLRCCPPPPPSLQSHAVSALNSNYMEQMTALSGRKPKPLDADSLWPVVTFTVFKVRARWLGGGCAVTSRHHGLLRLQAAPSSAVLTSVLVEVLGPDVDGDGGDEYTACMFSGALQYIVSHTGGAAGERLHPPKH